MGSPSSKLVRVLVLPCLWLAASTAPAQIDFERGPQQGQLYPRVNGDLGPVEVAGEVTSGTFGRVHLYVTRDGSLWDQHSQDLSFSGGRAPFTFTSEIEAGLVEYRFRVYLEGGGGVWLQRDVGNVVCGDAFLIQGQSNAVAGDSHGQGLANQVSQRHWLRSFGTGSLNGGETAADHNWYVADGEIGSSAGSVGGWGLRMGQLFVDELQVPVALLNGAIGATPIRWHQRNDADPESLATNYGRLLYRARQAGLDQHVRALFWYQGEADGGTAPLQYFHRFQNLRRDWSEDFPALEQFYVFQIHNGCGTFGMGIRELQRDLADLFPDVSLMSTTATTGHDGCHYYYSGYRQLGERIARLVARDLYGRPSPAGTSAPNVDTATFFNGGRDRIELLFRHPGQALIVDPGAEAYFQLDAPERVTGVTVVGNRLQLQLSASTAATTLSWAGHIGNGPWIRNGLGVGMLTFEIPIRP